MEKHRGAALHWFIFWHLHLFHFLTESELVESKISPRTVELPESYVRIKIRGSKS